MATSTIATAEEVANAISKEPALFSATDKPTLIQKILDKLNIKDLTPQQKDDILKAEIQKAKDETGKIHQGSFTNSVSPKLSSKEKVAIFTSIGTGLAAIADSIRTNPVLMQLAVAGSGLILATPVGQSIVGAIALCAVAYYAVLAVKAKFQGLYTVLRTLDEFTILLEKIQRMIRVTVFISGTYKFQINVDEINNQIKIILKRFEKTLKDVDIKEIESQATDAKKLETLSADTSKAAAGAAANAEATAEKAAQGQGEGPGPVQGQGQGQGKVPGGGGRRRYQAGGGWIDNIKSTYKAFTFPVEPWNRELLDDVTKLNIRLTTAMGEFTIVLNVIQMNMIADGFKTLKPTTGTPPDAVDKFVKHTTEVKESSEYKKMRIGILINDILSLRVDFEFCNQGKSGMFGTRPNDDAICLEYTQTDTAGNRIMTFRPDLHGMVIRLCENLRDGEGYDDAFKKVVTINVIDPYIKLLQDARFSAPESKPTIADTLERLNLKETSLLTDDDKKEIDSSLELLAVNVKRLSNSTVVILTDNILMEGTQAGGTQVGGIGIPSWFSKNKSPETPAAPTAETTTTPIAAPTPTVALPKAQNNIINYLKDYPVNIISHAALKSYLDNVYRFSKEITKPTDKETKETEKSVKESAPAPAPAGVSVPGNGQGAVVTDAAPAGGSRRNRKRPTTRKYIKSSSSVKRGKTYKIRI